MGRIRDTDPGGLYSDPHTTFEKKKTGTESNFRKKTDPTFEKTRIQSRPYFENMIRIQPYLIQIPPNTRIECIDIQLGGLLLRVSALENVFLV